MLGNERTVKNELFYICFQLSSHKRLNKLKNYFSRTISKMVKVLSSPYRMKLGMPKQTQCRGENTLFFQSNFTRYGCPYMCTSVRVNFISNNIFVMCIK